MDEEKLKKNIYKTVFFFFSLFLILILHLTYLQVFEEPRLGNHPLNQRASSDALQRGRILDKEGAVFAASERDANGAFYRNYPHHAMFSHITGYQGEKIGRTGIESYCNADLSGLNDPWRRLGAIAHIFGDGRGNDIRLTIRSKVQSAADRALGNRKGAVIVLDSKSGAILAMVSKPSFDANYLENAWETVRTDADSPLLNRALQGLYPPGSILKTMMVDAALAEKITTPDEIYDCPGYLAFDENYTMFESHGAVHGKVNLEEALTVSCNVTFARFALKLGAKKLEETFERFGFHQALDNELSEMESSLPQFRNLTDGELAQIGIGQGPLLTTPLRMALLASAFANGGVIMKPHLIDEVLSPGGSTIEKYTPEKWLEVTTTQRADLLQKFMRSVVVDGTASQAAVDGIRVSGKTGTAENAGGETHAWFIGSAQLPTQEVAFAILVENGGGGGGEAAPIVRKIILNSLMN